MSCHMSCHCQSELTQSIEVHQARQINGKWLLLPFVAAPNQDCQEKCSSFLDPQCTGNEQQNLQAHLPAEI